MNQLTRNEAIKLVAAATGESRAATEKTIDAFIGEIEKALAQGSRVEFRNFGVWEVRMSKPRVGRNPQHPEQGPLQIPSKPVIRFRLGNHLRESVRTYGQSVEAALAKAVPVRSTTVLVAEPVSPNGGEPAPAPPATP